MSDVLWDLAASRRRSIALIFAAVLVCCGMGPAAAQTVDEELLSPTGSEPALAADARGGFVVLWTDTEAENEGLGIRGCLLAPKDGSCGPHFAVNTTAAGDQVRPAVAADDPGRFVVAWQGALEAGRTGIFGQRFGAGGVKLGSELLLARSEEGSLRSPRLALGGGGDFIAAWENDQGSGSSRETARFSAKGKPVGPVLPMDAEGAGALAVFKRPEGLQLRLNSDLPPCDEDRCEAVAAVAMDARGRFVVIWEVTERGTLSNLFAQLFTPAGKPRTERIPVNATPSLGFEFPAVALANDGTVLVAWKRSDAQHPELYVRRLRLQ